uniref:Uncharacterized protein n=1 Tax=Anguilla anguilla TaxID=7936 RepID=A0A0E9SK26_ANGAN
MLVGADGSCLGEKPFTPHTMRCIAHGPL